MKQGDYVQLTNGEGPVMVVTGSLWKYTPDGVPQRAEEMIECGWFDEVNHWHTAKMPVVALESIE